MSAAHTNMNVAPTHVNHTRTRTYRLSHTTQTLCRTIAAPLPHHCRRALSLCSLSLTRVGVMARAATTPHGLRGWSAPWYGTTTQLGSWSPSCVDPSEGVPIGSKRRTFVWKDSNMTRNGLHWNVYVLKRRPSYGCREGFVRPSITFVFMQTRNNCR